MIQTASIKCTTVNYNAHTPIYKISVLIFNGDFMSKER